MTFSNDCLRIFGTKDLFIILNLERTSTNLTSAKIKKAYYQQSILWHPDRFAASDIYSDEEREVATKKFQILSKAYNILSDSEKRSIYMETGKFDFDDDDEENSKDWFSVWRGMFKKVTKEDIEEYLKKFRGSQQEMNDVKNAYVKYKGDMDKILETVIGADVQNEDRIREIIRHFIELGELPSLPKYKNEKPISRVRRMKRAAYEAKRAEKVVEEMRALGSAGGSKDGEEENGGSRGGKEDLGSLISANQKKREKQQDDFLAHLEQKYGGNPKPKKSRKN
uniref:J domain-containing protein n=1 Tax=Meloidogyne incognita TaxID=6306 RepID=A0A914KXI6_MELIC